MGMSRFAKSIPADVERYVDEGKAQGMDEGKAWAVAWSRFCKYTSPGDDHCSGGPDEYLRGKNAASRVEYPDYDPNVSARVRKALQEARKTLDKINGLVYRIESSGGTKAQESKVAGEYKNLIRIGGDLIDLSNLVLQKFNGKTTSPQTGLRVRTLQELTEELRKADIALPTMMFRISDKSEKLYGLISGVGGVLDNLWDRSTKPNAARVAGRFLTAAHLGPGLKKRLNQMLASVGMDGKATYPNLFKAWADIQMVVLRRNKMYLNATDIPSTVGQGTVTLPIYTTYGGPADTSLTVSWELVEGGYLVLARVG